MESDIVQTTEGRMTLRQLAERSLVHAYSAVAEHARKLLAGFAETRRLDAIIAEQEATIAKGIAAAQARVQKRFDEMEAQGIEDLDCPGIPCDQALRDGVLKVDAEGRILLTEKGINTLAMELIAKMTVQ